MYLILFALIVFFVAIVVAKKLHDDRSDSDVPTDSVPKYNYSLYQKKKYLFDTNSEFYFFCMVNKILDGKYYVFPQINYSHLISIDRASHYEQRRYRSHIERKSADFVICDKQTCVPLLVIDIDGNVHNREENKIKDEEIDSILNKIRLPIIRIKNSEVENRELIRSKILEKLKP